uniref:Receptor activity-modifying protein 3 n=1 Tax=Equus asinus TaxID=9793 RepID=A0A9L0J4R5_EQUAS
MGGPGVGLDDTRICAGVIVCWSRGTGRAEDLSRGALESGVEHGCVHWRGGSGAGESGAETQRLGYTGWGPHTQRASGQGGWGMDPGPADLTGVTAGGCTLPMWPGATESRWPSRTGLLSPPSGEQGCGETGSHGLCPCRYYDSFTNCTEEESTKVGCYWPNPLAQGLIIGIHRQFFSNCTVDRPHWEDPSDEVLIPLVIVPVLLTVAMAGLVVWRSKRTDQLL